MELFLLSFLIMVLAALGMAVGVMTKKRPITAGCGNFGGQDNPAKGCEICGDTSEPKPQPAASLLTPHDRLG